jgi:hypothetical protein
VGLHSRQDRVVDVLLLSITIWLIGHAVSR